MKARRITGACLSLVFASAAAFAQQPAKPSVTERTYLRGGLAPARVVERRIVESDGRETVVGTEERPDADGRWTPIEQIVHETNRSADGSVRTTRTVSGFDFDRRRTLLERTEGIESPSVNGIARSIEDTWVADINGGLGLASRRIEERNTVDSDVRQTSTTMLTRGINGALQESHRTAQTARRLDPSVVRHETAHMDRDPNGRWTAVAAHSADVRSEGEEETVHTPDTNGRLVPSERIVTRRSGSDGQEQVIVETYSQGAEGFMRSGGRMALSRRIRRTTTTTADGESTVEEIEARSRVSPSDPMRVVQRTVVTVRNIAPDRRVTERQVFELDVNGRLAPVVRETEETLAK
jgi:hypothetical protein